jgi:hypothetical protein
VPELFEVGCVAEDAAVELFVAFELNDRPVGCSTSGGTIVRKSSIDFCKSWLACGPVTNATLLLPPPSYSVW